MEKPGVSNLFFLAFVLLMLLFETFLGKPFFDQTLMLISLKGFVLSFVVLMGGYYMMYERKIDNILNCIKGASELKQGNINSIKGLSYEIMCKIGHVKFKLLNDGIVNNLETLQEVLREIGVIYPKRPLLYNFFCKTLSGVINDKYKLDYSTQ